MSTMFPKPVMLESYPDGGYVGGRWVDGTMVLRTFMGGVQPLPSRATTELREHPSGRQDIGRVRIYANTPLKVGVEGGERGDIVHWEGRRYEIRGDASIRMGILPHYKYIAEYIGEVTP